MYCVDASVVVSAARGGEPDSERSRTFWHRIAAERTPAFLPELAIAEIGWGLFHTTKRTDFVREFVYSLRAVPNLVFIPVDNRLVNRALEVIIATNLKSADAIYTALAIEYGLTLVTIDRVQLIRSKKVVPVTLP